MLTVNVINGTEKENVPSGDTVHLYIYEHEKLIKTLDGKVGDDGKVIFDVTVTEEHQTALAKVLHEGMSFSSRQVQLK